MSDWISVKDKLPDIYEYVLIYGQMEGNEPSPMSIGRYDGKQWELLVDDENNAVACGDLTWSIEIEDITHWMSLPKRPKIT